MCYVLFMRLFLIILGWINTVFLAYKHLSGDDSCLVNQSCNDVILSEFGTFLGVPVAVFGLVYYTMLLYLRLQNQLNKNNLSLVENVFIIIGVVVSTVLMIIQFSVLRSFCIYCTLSASIIYGLAILTLYQRRLSR
ncbi:hypothetical protein DID76_04600 [Candidatus Marinamargulisbacteria bacterium SCGC AG-414-C22]|nr:hypothetical protein DID76_04600 [Candidatus Marinamargulisbacteria bacterium SCGC AG-414-C22]